MSTTVLLLIIIVILTSVIVLAAYVVLDLQRRNRLLKIYNDNFYTQNEYLKKRYKELFSRYNEE